MSVVMGLCCYVVVCIVVLLDCDVVCCVFDVFVLM